MSKLQTLQKIELKEEKNTLIQYDYLRSQPKIQKNQAFWKKTKLFEKNQNQEFGRLTLHNSAIFFIQTDSSHNTT